MCKKTRLVSLFLALTLSLAACGSNGSGNGDSTGTSAESSDQTETEETKIDHLTEIPAVDFGGGAIRMIVQSASDRPYLQSEEETGEIINDAMIARDRKVSEMFNCSVEYTDYTDRGLLYQDLTKLVTAGEDAYDIVITTLVNRGVGELSAAGMLYDLGSLDALTLDADWWCRSMTDTMTFGNKIYALSGPMSLCYCYSPYALFANLSMAEDFKLGGFYDLVSSGKWTIDVMSEMMKNVYSDLNSNGAVDPDDRFPLTVTDESGNAFYIGCGQRMSEKTPTSVSLIIDSNKSIDLLDKLNSIMKTDEVMKTDSLGKNFPAFSSDHKTQMFINSQALFCAAPMQWGVLNFRDMKDDYAILPYPKADEEQDDYYSHVNSYFPVGIAIPATCPRADEIASVMEAMAYISNGEILPKINEVVLKEKIARDEHSKAMLDIIYSNMTVDFNCVFNLASTSSMVRLYAIGSTENFSSNYASVKTRAETELAELFDKLMGEN